MFSEKILVYEMKYYLEFLYWLSKNICFLTESLLIPHKKNYYASIVLTLSDLFYIQNCFFFTVFAAIFFIDWLLHFWIFSQIPHF